MVSETYAQRALRERPIRTKSGMPVTIVVNNNGKVYAHTASGSVYVPSDFPTLFGWKRYGIRVKKAPLTLKHKGYTYIRTVKAKQ